MFLFVDKGGQYEADSEEYVKYLIKANNESITDEEIKTLLEEAKQIWSFWRNIYMEKVFPLAI